MPNPAKLGEEVSSFRKGSRKLLPFFDHPTEVSFKLALPHPNGRRSSLWNPTRADPLPFKSA